MTGGFVILDHPSDIGIEATGSDIAEVFRNAAAGLMSVLIDPATVSPSRSHEISLTAADTGMLLVRWLSELLYLFDGRDFVASEYAIMKITETSLRAVVRGESLDRSRHITRQDVKAVTYHQLRIVTGAGGMTATVYLDI